MNESVELIPFKWILRGKYGWKSGFCEVNWLRRVGISAPGPPPGAGEGAAGAGCSEEEEEEGSKDGCSCQRVTLALPRPRDQEKRPSEGGGESSNGSESRSGVPPPLTETRVFWLLEPPAPVMERKQGERLRARS